MDENGTSTPLPGGAVAIGDILRKAGCARAANIIKLHAAWETIIGAQLACHVHPAALSEEQLLVSVDSPIWAQELLFHQTTLIDRIKQVSGIKISSIRTRVGHDR